MPESTVGIMVVVGFVLISFVIVGIALRSVVRATGRIKNTVVGTAIVQGIGETGTTISAPNVGPEAPVYRIQLLISPPAGAVYPVETTRRAVAAGTGPGPGDRRRTRSTP